MGGSHPERNRAAGARDGIPVTMSRRHEVVAQASARSGTAGPASPSLLLVAERTVTTAASAAVSLCQERLRGEDREAGLRIAIRRLPLGDRLVVCLDRRL